MVLQGLSYTFLSGSWDSLFYESLKSHKDKNYYEIFGKIRFWSSVFPIFIFAGWIGSLDILYPFYLCIIAQAFICLIILFFKETGKQFQEKINKKTSFRDIAEDISSGYKKIIQNPTLKLIFFIFFVIDVIRQPLFLLIQTRMSDLGFDAFQFGLLQDLWGYLGLILIYLTSRLISKLGKKNLVEILFIGVGVFTLGMGLIPHKMTLLLCVPCSAFILTLMPIIEKEFNDNILDQDRSLLNSYFSTISSIGVLGLQALSSIFLSINNQAPALIFIGIFLLIYWVTNRSKVYTHFN